MGTRNLTTLDPPQSWAHRRTVTHRPAVLVDRSVLNPRRWFIQAVATDINQPHVTRAHRLAIADATHSSLVPAARSSPDPRREDTRGFHRR